MGQDPRQADRQASHQGLLRKKRDDLGLWKGFDVELGEGDAGWPAVMKALDEIGYSTDPKGNWATAEVGGGDAARLKRIADQMDKIFAS